MMFLWLPFLIVIPFAIFWMARPGTGTVGCCGAARSAHPQAPTSSGSEPIEIARLRLARGEITAAEFEEIRRTIG